MRRGCWGRTTGPELISEHGVWLSLFSGVSRGQHGYYFYRQLQPGTYDLRTVTGCDIDAPPFWTFLTGRGKKAALIDIPDSGLWPGLPGVQLANWATHHNWDPSHFTTASEPPALLAEVAREFGPKLTVIENHKSTYRQDLLTYRRVLQNVALKGALCRRLLVRDRFELMVTVFAECHAANHQFWKYRPGSGMAPCELTHGIRDVYQAIDRELGLLLAELPPEVNVFVVSSVGMEDDYPTTGLIEAFCRRLGYQATPISNGPSLRPLDLARRWLPESWRIALSRHLPRSRREQLLAEQFRRSTDWGRTTAFAIPSNYTSFLRVNLRGREPQGVVAPGADYEVVLHRLDSDLRQLVDAETGEPAVSRVARTTELFGNGAAASLPDLFVEWKPGRFLQRVLHPCAELVQGRPDFYRVSDHSSQGFVAASGPDIAVGAELGEVSVLDLAPTFLSLLGQPVSPGLTGKVLKGMTYLLGQGK
jgi:predicted AlkP superfamily phosphohydrolase/phosphomutase